MPLGWRSGMMCPARSISFAGSKAMACLPPSMIRPSARIRASVAAASSGQVRSGTKPARPSTLASTVPCPTPVSASEPCSSTAIRATSSSLPRLASARTKSAPIRIGPTVCEEDGPMPIRKISSTESIFTPCAAAAVASSGDAGHSGFASALTRSNRKSRPTYSERALMRSFSPWTPLPSGSPHPPGTP